MAANSGNVLQRIRFGRISHASYANEDFFKSGFDASRWGKAGTSCYWSVDGTSEGLGFENDRVRIGLGQELKADSYFNAFYVGHWRALTAVRALGLRLQFSGRLSIRLIGHTPLATDETLLAEETPEGASSWESLLPSSALAGNYLRVSFSVQAQSEGAELTGGHWFTPESSLRSVSLAVVTPTYNRPHFARKTVTDLLSDPELAPIIQRVVLVEQSEKPELADLTGEKCLCIQQANYGSSGGYARGIFECSVSGTVPGATHLLLLDDDIMVETDSILRVARFAAYATGNSVLGGGMLDLFQPNRVVALGESIERSDAGYYSISQVYPAADISRASTLDFASIPRAEGYCAWWFCLMPLSLVESIGLPWAGFLRWDDINYGVRAKAAGFQSYMIPGIAVWHVPFYSKSVPWMAYFDKYNELVQNALLDQSAVDAYCLHIVRETRICIESHKLGLAAAMALALEHYATGWPLYKSRTFPDFLAEIKTFISGYGDLSKEGTDVMKRAAADALELRLRGTEVRLQSEAGRLRTSFAEKIPGTYTADAWRDYFVRGNLLGNPALQAFGDQTEVRNTRFRKIAGLLPDMLRFLRALPASRLADPDFLENEVLPLLGVDDETLKSRPPELDGCLGRGLHVARSPRQFARYLLWLKAQAPRITSYCEIGCKWGGSMIVVCEWLRLNGARLSKVIAIETTPPSPFLERYLVDLHQSGVVVEYLQESTRRPAVRAYLAKEKPEMVSVDGDRSIHAVLEDHLAVREFAQIITHNDVSADSNPQMGMLWENLCMAEGKSFHTQSFTDQYPSVHGRHLGLGAMIRGQTPDPTRIGPALISQPKEDAMLQSAS